MTKKKMSITALILTLVLLLAFGGITAFLDPFFLYHGPWDWQNYVLYNERYQNDGITRYFTYDAIITGTSMTENFMTSEFDALFDVQSVKVPFSGGSYKEIGDFVDRAIQRNSDLKLVIRGLDTNRLLTDKDDMRYSSYPEYLYDDFIFNDVNYLFNKDIFVDDTCYLLQFMRSGQPSTSFDEYANWHKRYTFGKDSVMKTYARRGHLGEHCSFTDEDAKIVEGTITQNVLQQVKNNPQVDFYLFFTPYSILYWDDRNQSGNVQRHIEAQRVAIEMLIPYDNVHLFSFFDEFDVICDLDNYKDIAHYGENVNSWMLQKMARGENRLTQENYEAYLKKISDFYTNYPYDSLFE